MKQLLLCMSSGASEEPSEYDICLSFAGQQRDYVERVAVALKARGLRVYYDAHERAHSWGKELHVHLTWVYRDAARFCVLFLSREYASRYWTSVELESAQARAFRENREYILPARFDDTEIPGVKESVVFIDLRRTTPEELVENIISKMRDEDARRVDPIALLRPLASSGRLTVATVDNTRGIGRVPAERRPRFKLGSTVRIVVDLPRAFETSVLNVERMESSRRSYLGLDPLLRLTQPLAAGSHVLPALPVGEPAGRNCLIVLGRESPFNWGGEIPEADVIREAQAFAQLADSERFVAFVDYDAI